MNILTFDIDETYTGLAKRMFFRIS